MTDLTIDFSPVAPTTQELLLAMALEIGGGLPWKGAKHGRSYGFVVDHQRIYCPKMMVAGSVEWA